MAERTPADTRGQFIDTATRLFALRGFYGVSIAAIADELGLTKQALLHHFGTKEKLYGEVLASISAAFAAAVATAETRGGSAEERLTAVILQLYDRVSTHPEESHLLMRELLDNRRRADQAGTWYLKDFLDNLVGLAQRTARWRDASRAEALAGVYQLLGAVTYVAVSDMTLASMFGAEDYENLRNAYPAELQKTIQAMLALK